MHKHTDESCWLHRREQNMNKSQKAKSLCGKNKTKLNPHSVGWFLFSLNHLNFSCPVHIQHKRECAYLCCHGKMQVNMDELCTRNKGGNRFNPSTDTQQIQEMVSQINVKLEMSKHLSKHLSAWEYYWCPIPREGLKKHGYVAHA